MGQQPEHPDLDADLDRMVRTTGRMPIGGAVLLFLGAGAIVLIDRLFGGAPTFLAYVAVAVIVAGVAPSLLAIGLDWRRRTLRWAEDEQRLRLAERMEALQMRRELEQHRAALAEGQRRRGSPTSRQRALQSVDVTQESGDE